MAGTKRSSREGQETCSKISHELSRLHTVRRDWTVFVDMGCLKSKGIRARHSNVNATPKSSNASRHPGRLGVLGRCGEGDDGAILREGDSCGNLKKVIMPLPSSILSGAASKLTKPRRWYFSRPCCARIEPVSTLVRGGREG